MKDQAEKLREMITNIKKRNQDLTKDTSFINGTNVRNNARIIAITSGKGGVGKSNFTINLGLALTKVGYKVTILDADLGLANIDVIVGLIPKYTLAHVIRSEKTIEEIIVEGPNGIKLISGGSGLKELVDLTNEQLLHLINNLKHVEKFSDFILIDTGAGINNSVLSFVNAASEIILVTTPEPTSITDAYAMIKNILSKDKDKIINVLINRVESYQEGLEIFNKLNTAAQRFLKAQLTSLGYLFDDILVSRSVKSQNPFILKYPNSLISKGVDEIAARLINEKPLEVHEITGMRRFIDKLLNYYK
ncbi:MinD/ParA family protein [Clostridiaceae bacterium 35-E11]